MVAQCYVTQSSYIPTALEAWKGFLTHQDVTPMLTVVVVPRLPRGAVVEWHVLASVSDPVDQKNFSASIQRSGYQARLNGSISSCKTCASLVLSVSASTPQEPGLHLCHVNSLVRDVLQKASLELTSLSLIPVCCRTFYRSNNLGLQSLHEDLLAILKEVWGENAPCLVLVPVIDLLSSELLNISIWLSC
uniref:Uncharacterized protein n=2 Tax=Pyxicephalus adspersus TaxID=30357 RepID=A0AAV2ZR26_PYXAD|nr:TPA: hypothetical protein GDO54_005221 [Pyxicephalus adspersus]